VNYPLATLIEQFLKERRFLKNVTEPTLVWYRVAFRNYRALIPASDAARLPSKALQRSSSVCANGASGQSPATPTSGR
jgi:hypothetical protein